MAKQHFKEFSDLKTSYKDFIHGEEIHIMEVQLISMKKELESLFF